MMKFEVEAMSVAEFAEMRRIVLRTLDSAVPDIFKLVSLENACQHLYREGVIRAPVADLVHVAHRCRNRAEHQDPVPEGMEAHAVRSAWAAMEDWRSNYRGMKPRNVTQEAQSAEARS